MYYLNLLIFFLFGAAIGSFLNVLIDRLSTGRDFVKGRSYCEHCKKTLKAHDLIPLFSFLVLKGKCRYCHTKIPVRLFFVELFVAILLPAVYLYSATADLNIISGFCLAIILVCFVGIFVADFVYGIIPDGFVLVSLAASLLFVILNHLGFSNHFLAGIGSLVFFLSLFLITRGKGMGFGDVKLSFVLGFLLGFPNIVVALYMAFLTGAAVSIILVVWRRIRFFGGTIPFGPFLIASTVIAFFFGDMIVRQFLTNVFPM